MPYLEDSTLITPLLPSIYSDRPSTTIVSDRPDDSVFASDPSSETSYQASAPEPPMHPFLEEVLGVLKGNPLKGMETSIPLTLQLTWDPITNAHVTTVKTDDMYHVHIIMYCFYC